MSKEAYFSQGRRDVGEIRGEQQPFGGGRNKPRRRPPREVHQIAGPNEAAPDRDSHGERPDPQEQEHRRVVHGEITYKKYTWKTSDGGSGGIFVLGGYEITVAMSPAGSSVPGVDITAEESPERKPGASRGDPPTDPESPS